MAQAAQHRTPDVPGRLWKPRDGGVTGTKAYAVNSRLAIPDYC